MILLPAGLSEGMPAHTCTGPPRSEAAFLSFLTCSYYYGIQLALNWQAQMEESITHRCDAWSMTGPYPGGLGESSCNGMERPYIHNERPKQVGQVDAKAPIPSFDARRFFVGGTLRLITHITLDIGRRYHRTGAGPKRGHLAEWSPKDLPDSNPRRNSPDPWCQIPHLVA